MRSNAETNRVFFSRSAFAGFVVLTLLAACTRGDNQASTDSARPDSTAVATAGGSGGAGEQAFQRCATCHMANGTGVPGAFPPLAGSEYATASNPAVPIRIVMHGMQGPLTVKGTQYNGVMPPYGTGVEMSDEEIAAVLTYVRQSWGNSASAITAQQVSEVRAAARSATGPMTAEELKTLMSGG